MRFAKSHLTLIRTLLLLTCAARTATASDTDPVDFNRDIRPILSDRCLQCHGPDEDSREGGFRLDLRDSAVGEADSGEHPIVPGDPDASEVLRRVTSTDDDERMPLPKANKPALTPAEASLVRRWIEQGAKYQAHWAFSGPQPSPLPDVRQTDWPLQPLDYFVLARLERNGLQPNPPADRATLCRRVTFDLTGLPPTPEQIEAFQHDTTPGAYEALVDRLLGSEQFGEHLCRIWLDAARYADSNGYLHNAYRVSWPWRDWVVRAFNDNKPYDRFITEMLAGDLVPDANEETRLATCFLRLHMITTEGGSLDDEFRIEYAADRAETVGTALMGVTMNCCRCHDHKFDPLAQQEYYQLLAMLADPKGEDPVSDHGREPAFTPFIRLDRSRYQDEATRLEEALATAEASGNANSKLRLTLQKKMFEQGLPVMVMEENPAPPQNYVLTRGAYDAPQKDRPVQRGAVESLLPWNDQWPRNRLGLAQWLTDPAHPLTARVEVNRIWTALLGQGLVETQENFGQQGAYPTHPALLDTLSVSFRDGGWDRKALVRQIVTSATYRQSSVRGPQHEKLDSSNRLLTRMNRRRLSAEAVRDQALFVSGLLDLHVGGHPVLPYQPDGLWREGANNPGYKKGQIVQTGIYEQSSGAELYRRSLYTFWNRNAPPPQLLLLDAPERSFAAVGRTTTNTPLQALVTMNDTQFVEASRFLAERTLRDSTLADDPSRLANMYRRCTGRILATDDQQALLAGLAQWRDRYREDQAAAQALLTSGGAKPSSAALDAAEHAAWMLVATTIMNLDATLVVD